MKVRGRGLIFVIDIKNEEITNFIYNEPVVKGYIVGNRCLYIRIDQMLIISEIGVNGIVDTFMEI